MYFEAIYFFQDAKNVTEYLGALAADQVEKLEKSMEEKGSYDVDVKDKTFSITKDMISKVRNSKYKISTTISLIVNFCTGEAVPTQGSRGGGDTERDRALVRHRPHHVLPLRAQLHRPGGGRAADLLLPPAARGANQVLRAPPLQQPGLQPHR